MYWCCRAPPGTWGQRYVSQSSPDPKRNIYLHVHPFRECSAQRTCRVGWVKLHEMSGHLEGLLLGGRPVAYRHCNYRHEWSSPRRRSGTPSGPVQGSGQRGRDPQCVRLLRPACRSLSLWRLSLCVSEASVALPSCGTAGQLQIAELAQAPLFENANVPFGLPEKTGSGGRYGLMQRWGRRKVEQGGEVQRE